MSNLSQPPLAALAGAERIIRFTSYEEIAARPNFRESLTPDEAKPVKIIGVYIFRDKRRCSLPDRTPHLKGLVVETVSGYEIIIGKDCGRNAFGAQFQVLFNAAQAQAKKQDRQDQLIAFRQRLPHLNGEIARMRTE